MQTPRYHALFDVRAIHDEVSTREALDALLRELVVAVDMQILAGPLIAEGHPDNPGLTGIVVVDYSHISIHTFTAHAEALIDVFSCKPYDRERVRALLNRRVAMGTQSVIREQLVHWGS